jgi:arylsulfatase A-like enzyme
VQVPPYLPQSDAARKEFAELQGVIRAMDTAMGRIWHALTEAGLAQDTWFIFTTDHGLAMPRAKCTLYDPGIKTALLMHAPAFGIVGGRVYDALISNVDIVPTILEMLGLAVPARLHGASFAPLLQARAYTPRTEIFAEKTFHTAYEPQRAIRTARFKLIWNVEAGIMNVPADIMQSPIYPEMIQKVVKKLPHLELYDLALDANEQTNLHGNPHYAEIFHDLRARLLEWMRETDDPLLRGAIVSPFYQRGLEMLSGSTV